MFARRTQWKLTPNRLSAALEHLRAQSANIFGLTEFNPTHCGFEYDENGILAALADRAALQYYPAPKGLRSAREAVADYYRESSNNACSIDPDDIILTASTSEAYSFIFRLLCDPGDEVLVPTPSYPLFEFLADLLDIRIKPYPLIYDHGWQIDFHSLEGALSPRARAVIVVHPNNPTGSFVRSAEAAQLNKIGQAHGTAIIADEVFLDYSHDPEKHRASFSDNGSALTFTLSGLSKISALPQMKLAWIATSGPEQLVRQALARMEVIADTYLSVNTPVQIALPSLLRQRHSISQQLLSRIRTNLTELDRQIAQQGLCSRLEVEGGWYAVLRIPVTQSDEEFALELLEKRHVLVHPGHFYDFPSDGYLVLSLITPTEPFRAGIEKILDFFA